MVDNVLQLRPDVPVYESVLVLSRLEELDNGSYSCRATNRHGSAIMTHPYTIRVEPGNILPLLTLSLSITLSPPYPI